MFQAMRETTKWEGGLKINHIYLLEGDRAAGYIPHGRKVPFYFNTPIRIDLRGRTFDKLVTGQYFPEYHSDDATIAVKGSKGETYWVDPINKTCTCVGFQFRRDCKHLATVR